MRALDLTIPAAALRSQAPFEAVPGLTGDSTAVTADAATHTTDEG